jgi:serine phosphatase RsbU (regulator of sigma subunit)
VADQSKLLWISNMPVHQVVHRAAQGRWKIIARLPGQPFEDDIDACDFAVVYLNGESDNPVQMSRLVDRLEVAGAVGVFILPDTAKHARQILSGRQGAIICVSNTITQDELLAKFDAAAALAPAVRNLRSEIDHLLDTRKGMSNYDPFAEEMRLASRLQRDFLPRELPEVGDARFSVLFRPASWVSGDIYDVMRLDETHIGFYVVDAVGHGMPAALLTMFIRRSLQTKKITGQSYQIIPPDQALAALNEDICQEDLPGSQFCTGVYGVLDTESLELTYVRAGHPEPIWLHPDGATALLKGDGDLLGVFPETTYHANTIQLAPGDRIILYTDGAEEALADPSGQVDPKMSFLEGIDSFARLSRDDVLLQMTALLDIRFGRTGAPDDVTLLILDIDRD